MKKTKKTGREKNKPLFWRLVILFFHCVLLAALLWAARFARYRYQYVFREALPYALPALAGAALIAWIVLLALRLRGKKGGTILSLDFCLFLLAGTVLAPGLLCFTLASPVLMLFRIVADLALILICGGAIGYALYYLLRKPVGLFAGVLSLDLAAFLFYFRLYAHASSAILTSERGFPPEQTVLAWLGAALIAVLLGAFLLGLRDPARFGLPFWLILLPGALSFAGILFCRFLPLTAFYFHYGLWIAFPIILLLTCFFKPNKKACFPRKKG